MKSLSRLTLGLLIALLIAVVPLFPAAAQPSDVDTVFTSQVTGDDVVIGDGTELQFNPDDYSLSTNDTFQEEYIWIWSTYSSFELILIDGPTDAEEYSDITLGNMETFYDSWTLLGTESDADTAWFLGEGEIDGGVLYVYFEYEVDVFGDVDFAYMQFSGDIDLIPDMQLAQELITVGGLSVPLNADMETISELTGMPYDGATSTPEEETTTTTTTGRTSRTSTQGTDNTTETSGTKSRTSRTSTQSTDTTEETSGTTSRTSRTTSVDTDEANDSETSGNRNTTSSTDTTEADDVAGGDWASMGLIDDATWESPTHGSTVEWDVDLWEFPVDYDSAILIDPDGWDSLTLQTTDGLGYVFVTVDYANENTPKSLLDYWQSDDYLSGVGPDAVVIDSARNRDSASIVYSTFNLAEEPILVIMDGSFQADGTVVYTQLTAAPETLAEVYADYVDGVFYNGAALNLTWDVEEIGELQP